MVIFNEHFPQKLAILTFMKQQKTLSEVAIALKNDKEEKKLPLLQSTFEMPRKESWMDAIAKIQSEADDYVKKSEEINEKINDLHEAVEAIDDKDCEIKLSQECLLKNSESVLAIKRVHQLEGGDSVLEYCKRNDKKSAKKIPDMRQKSKFTTVAKKVSSNNVVEKKAQTTAKPSSSMSTLSRKSLVMSVKVSPSVRKILDDAKEKHTSMKSRKEMPMNTVTLELK